MGDLGSGVAPPVECSEEELRSAALTVCEIALNKARRNHRRAGSDKVKRDVYACLLALGVTDRTPQWFEDADCDYLAFYKLGARHQFRKDDDG